MADISLLQLARSLQSNAVSGVVQKLGAKWPPPPIISIRSVGHCLPNMQWTSYERTQSVQPLSLCTPQDLTQLVAIIRNPESNGRRVHAVGSGWSFSDCAITADVLIDTTRLWHPIQTVQQAITAAPKPLVFHVQAGIAIHDLYIALNNFIDPLSGASTPLALETMGGASGQTLAGVVSTGTHGGDLFMGPIADSVLAIHLVGASGTQYWIEPTAAITDKSLLRQFVVPDIPLENIIYDDDWFNAVLVSVGCMGVIYAVVLRVRPQYFLIETTSATTWQQFKQTAAAQLSDTSSRFLQVAINPYSDGSGNNYALLTTRKEVPNLPVLPPLPPVQPPTKDVVVALLHLVGDLLLANPIFTVQNILGDLNQILDGILTALEAGRLPNPSDFPNATNLLIQLINNILTDAPELRSILATAYSNIMSASWPPGTVGDISFKIMDANRFRPSLGSVDVDPPRVDSVGGYSIEIFLPTNVTGGTPPTPYYIGFIDDVVRMVNAADGTHSMLKTFLLGYVGIRFTGPTRAFLGMQQWNQTCSVEISTLPNVNGELALLTAILDSIYDFPQNSALPLPHWGQCIDLNIQGYGDRYPNYAKWQKVYGALSNNFTTRTFENALSDRWQLTFRPSFMSVGTQFLHKITVNQVVNVTIRVTVQNTTAGGPVEGATVTVFDEDFLPPLKKASGNTGADGTVQLTYAECIDPETKTPLECSGRVRKERYQDVYFITPVK